MKRKQLIILSLIALVSVSCSKQVNPSFDAFVVASDYVRLNSSEDVADAIQKMIDENPNRTLYFPDGVYNLSHPVMTPADPTKSVHLVMGNYATFKAIGEWGDGGALVHLGGKEPYNSIRINGSNYGIEGGIFDGSGVADGISIDSGRETKVMKASIKNTRIGLHIMRGANNGSSDCDIVDVNIVGNDQSNSIGVLIEGHDNTLTNMRIASVNVGVMIMTGGNSLKNIHPLYIFADSQDYESSCGFVVARDMNNWLDYCYSDQFCTGFKLGKGVGANLTDCFAWWYNGNVSSQNAVVCDGPFSAVMYGMHVGFSKECPVKNILVAEKGGSGTIRNTILPRPADLSPADVSGHYTVR